MKGLVSWWTRLRCHWHTRHGCTFATWASDSAEGGWEVTWQCERHPALLFVTRFRGTLGRN